MRKAIVFFLFILIFFTPKPVTAWWDNNYNHRFKYLINNNNVGENLSNFPLLINLSDNVPEEFWDNIQTSGYDIRIIDQDGVTNLTPYSHFEYFDYDTQTAYLWIRKTILAAGSPNFVWIYYANSEATNPFSTTTKNNTYGSAFAMVHHFEDTFEIYDETANAIDGTNAGNSYATNGLIYRARYFDGDGDYITIADVVDESSPPFTYSFWIYANNVSDTEQIIYQNHSANPTLKLIEDDIVFAYNSLVNGQVDCRASNVLTANTWHHLGIIAYSNNDLKIFLNGQEQTVTGYCTIDPVQNLGSGSISGSGSASFSGLFDEFRILNTIVSPEWFKFTTINDKGMSGTPGQEQPFYVTNLDPVINAYLSSDWSSDIQSTVLEGVYPVGVKTATHRIASFAVDFYDSFSWSLLSADSDADNFKSFFHYPGGYSSLPGASGTSFTLYIPKGDTYKVRICPQADSLLAVTRNCPNQYYLQESDSNVSVVEQDLLTYWQVTGLTGSGGQGVYPSLNFTVEGVGSNTLTNGITTNVATTTDTIDFGSISPGQAHFSAQKLTITTNAVNGYSVYAKFANFMQGNYPGNQISEFSYNDASWSSPQVWTSPTGNIPNINTGWIGANTSDTRVPNWLNASGKFGPFNTSNRLIMHSHQTDEDSTSVYITYGIEINSYQPTDKYIGNIIYTVLPIY